MSYDYNALVAKIAQERRAAQQLQQNDNDNDSQLRIMQHLGSAMETFDTLSAHCPMTPLLWMQHAATARQFMQLSSRINSDQVTGSDKNDDGSMAMNDNDDDANRATINDESYRTALQTQLDILELGLQEFPGSGLLQLCFAELLLQCQCKSLDEKLAAVETALQHVGQGSHLAEDDIIGRLFDIHLQLSLEQPDETTRAKAVAASLIWRSKAPLLVNESLQQEARETLLKTNMQQRDVDEILFVVERNRQRVAKAYSRLWSLGDDIEMSLHQLGVLAKHQLPVLVDADGQQKIDWTRVTQSGNQLYGMGLGEHTVAHAFIQYALAVQKQLDENGMAAARNESDASDNENGDNDEDDSIIPKNLPTAIYERAISECPTVESLWMSYARHLSEALASKSLPECELANVASKLQSVTQRAMRNCPNSLLLVEQRLMTFLTLLKAGFEVIDPDALLQVAQAALDTKFLPAEWQHLKVFLTAVRVVKLRILMLLTPKGKGAVVDYDDAEPLLNHKKKKAASQRVADNVLEEANDLVDDLTDMYEQVETRLKEAFPKWSAGRSLLWRDRALTSQLLLDNLQRLESGEQQNKGALSDKSAVHWFDKALRTSNPPHPDWYRSYIAAFVAAPGEIANGCDVARRIRHVRYLYQQGVKLVGRPKVDVNEGNQLTNAQLQRDFDTAFSCLCQEWLEFEQTIGSDRSIGRASHAIQIKMRKTPSQLSFVAAPSQNTLKRKYNEQITLTDEPPAKKYKVDDDNATQTKAGEATNGVAESTAATPPPGKLKVKVGDLEYPVHPYTVRISFLHPETEDMDLVELLRPKCGNIVHARIVRDKHPPFKSKGWGLVQFEEKDAVEKALALNDVIGLHEKVLRIERSQQPAVSLVPPGRHKISEKGHGKHSKRNEKKHKAQIDDEKDGTIPPAVKDAETKAINESDDRVAETNNAKVTKNAEALETINASGVDSFSFKPRNVARKSHQKPRLKLV
ncbi:hypothetical protein MPSEU_000327300 [Mayamaea pseudoterrestris]|nr:hypothetical protein MPSEU_000327300 [Mayamaea pseudoterrestris]